MKLSIIIVTSAVCLALCHADINVTDYVYWKKADIKVWHQLFPSRVLEEERLTSLAAIEAINSLDCSQRFSVTCGINGSLAGIVAFQAQELQTAQVLMAGTDAEGCVAGISNFIPNAINDEIVEFDDCIADTWSKIYRLKNTWNKVRSRYLIAYQRALTGIDTCAKTYPNKDSIDRLKSCVDSMNNNYYVAANSTQNSMIPSPVMSYFQKTVVQCASNAAITVAAKGFQFLKLLIECAKLSGTIDPQAYAKELNKWKGYNDTLSSQVLDAQIKNRYQVGVVETDIQNYYKLQKQVLEEYVIESRGFDYYLSKIYLYLHGYYNTVTETWIDNPGDFHCADIAKAQLDMVSSLGATKSLSCDLNIVTTTKSLMYDIYDNFFYLNNIMTGIGNAAILGCLSDGYVFAPDTITDCYELVYSKFSIYYTDRNATIAQKIDTISSYVLSFFNGSNLPCGETSSRLLYLGGESSLYNLQRCLYTSSGTTYVVTTPHTPNTTESTVTTTWTTNSTRTPTGSGTTSVVTTPHKPNTTESPVTATLSTKSTPTLTSSGTTSVVTTPHKPNTTESPVTATLSTKTTRIPTSSGTTSVVTTQHKPNTTESPVTAPLSTTSTPKPSSSTAST